MRKAAGTTRSSEPTAQRRRKATRPGISRARLQISHFCDDGGGGGKLYFFLHPLPSFLPSLLFSVREHDEWRICEGGRKKGKEEKVRVFC